MVTEVQKINGREKSSYAQVAWPMVPSEKGLELSPTLYRVEERKRGGMVV